MSPFQGGFAPGFGPLGPPASTPQTRAWELQGLHRLQAAMVLALATEIFGIVSVALINVSSFVSVSTSTGSSSVNLHFSPPWYWTVYLVVAAAAAITEFVLLRSSLRTLSFVDGRYSTPASLALLAVIGIMLVFLGLGLFLASLVQAVQCAGTGNPVPTSCLLTGGFWAGLGLIGVGGVIALIGYVGVVIGIWRVGTRYHSSTVQVGAFLLIIPYLGIVGALLILIGTQTATAQLRSTAPGSSFL